LPLLAATILLLKSSEWGAVDCEGYQISQPYYLVAKSIDATGTFDAVDFTLHTVEFAGARFCVLEFANDIFTGHRNLISKAHCSLRMPPGSGTPAGGKAKLTGAKPVSSKDLLTPVILRI
jgi:hypothetical protein